MSYLIKTIVAIFVMVSASELSKKSNSLAAMILALPIISFTTYTLIWIESKDNHRIADLALQNFYFVIPVIPVLPFFSWLLKSGFSFLATISLSTLLTIVLFWCFKKFFV
ncbi:MAG: DUF3147 family protein [Methylophilaceae bacterium]|jgi:uncharacterized membrane protein|nr:DUF3147 family protein [Methylophilaceae bacterium]